MKVYVVDYDSIQGNARPYLVDAGYKYRDVIVAMSEDTSDSGPDAVSVTQPMPPLDLVELFRKYPEEWFEVSDPPTDVTFISNALTPGDLGRVNGINVNIVNPRLAGEYTQ